MRVVAGNGYTVRYFRQRDSDKMRDPTMYYVANVCETVAAALNKLEHDHRGRCVPKVEWLDDFTCRITLPKNWRWGE